MKKSILLVLTVIFSLNLAIAQSEYSITLNAEEQEYGELTWKGYFVVVALDNKDVKDGLKDAMKDYGKVQTVKKMWVIDPANVPFIGQGNMLLNYSKEDKNNTRIWLSINKEGEYQDEATKNTLYDLAYKLYETDLTNKVDDAKKEQEKLVKTGENLAKKIDQANKNINKAEGGLKDSEKALRGLKNDLSKAELDRDKMKIDLETASSGKKKEKLEKAYEKAISNVLSIQKKLTNEEEQQLDYRKSIRENEQEGKDLEKEQKDNKKEQKAQTKVLEELNIKMTELIKLKRV